MSTKKNLADFEDNAKPGDWVYLKHKDTEYMLIFLEDSGEELFEKVIASCPFSKDGSNNTWTLTGTRDNPTLNPSILVTGVGDPWHGYLRNGKLEKC